MRIPKYRVWDNKRKEMFYNAEIFGMYQPVLLDEKWEIEEFSFEDFLVFKDRFLLWNLQEQKIKMIMIFTRATY